jgi:hypothetical protein
MTHSAGTVLHRDMQNNSPQIDHRMESPRSDGLVRSTTATRHVQEAGKRQVTVTSSPPAALFEVQGNISVDTAPGRFIIILIR